ncbi:MAG TPA: glycosyltransferase 87 family protein [Solirubrobacteraceae bacterium]|nr:glycosyltransferase 87 family protein [Solirubrobacteraceae bacterium]
MSDTPTTPPPNSALGIAGTTFGLRAPRAGSFSPDRQRTVLAVAAAMLGFVIAWYLIHHGWYALDRQWDTREYAKYANYIVGRGLFPYRDFSVEYPPLSLPIFILPRLLAGDSFSGYMTVFELMMAVCGVIAAGLSALVLSAQRVSNRQLACGVALIALSPVLLGAVVLSRYDLFPTMLTIAALAALYFDRKWSAFVLLGLGTAAKAYPIVILPLALMYVWRREGRRTALWGLAVFAAVVLVCFLPFAIIAPKGLWWAIHGQENRPLQLESVGAALFLAAHQLIGLHLSYYFTHSSDNLDGHVPMAFAGVMSILQLLSLVVVWLLYARGPATRTRLLASSAAAVCAFIVFDRVLSPQYLIWLAPMVAVIRGRRGLAAVALLACAMSMTQIYYPLHFDPLKTFEPLESWAVVGRDLVLCTLFVTLAWPEEGFAWRGGPAAWRRRLTAAP